MAIRVRSSLDDSGLILRSFGVSRQVLVASPGFVQAHGPFASAAALYEVLGMGPRGVNGEPPRWRLTSPQGTSELVDYRTRLFTEDVELLHHAALAGMGVAQLPLALCRGSIARGELVVLLGDHTLPVHQTTRRVSLASRTGAGRARLDRVPGRRPACGAGERRTRRVGLAHAGPAATRWVRALTPMEYRWSARHVQ